MRRLHDIMVRILSFLLETSMAVLVLDVLLGVVSRYVVGRQVSWTEELACLLLVWPDLQLVEKRSICEIRRIPCVWC